ncbi:hypothetical protein QJS66_11475 [Kocuria rhizophila]|nr:hypothetical protein QJS66_11475 [Kocuria rhizophila]
MLHGLAAGPRPSGRHDASPGQRCRAPTPRAAPWPCAGRRARGVDCQHGACGGGGQGDPDEILGRQRPRPVPSAHPGRCRGGRLAGRRHRPHTGSGGRQAAPGDGHGAVHRHGVLPRRAVLGGVGAAVRRARRGRLFRGGPSASSSVP